MQSDSIRSFLNFLTTITPIPDEELNFLSRTASLSTLEEGAYFVKAGNIPRQIGFVARGLLRIFYIDETASELTTGFFLQNSVAASYADFIKCNPTRYSVQALESSLLLTLDLQAYNALLQRHNCWQTISRKFLEEMFSKKLQRENDLLSCDAEERYRRFLADYPGLERRVKQYHIASYLGINPVSLSRIRAKIKSR